MNGQNRHRERLKRVKLRQSVSYRKIFTVVRRNDLPRVFAVYFKYGVVYRRPFESKREIA